MIFSICFYTFLIWKGDFVCYLFMWSISFNKKSQVIYQHIYILNKIITLDIFNHFNWSSWLFFDSWLFWYGKLGCYFVESIENLYDSTAVLSYRFYLVWTKVHNTEEPLIRIISSCYFPYVYLLRGVLSFGPLGLMSTCFQHVKLVMLT